MALYALNLFALADNTLYRQYSRRSVAAVGKHGGMVVSARTAGRGCADTARCRAEDGHGPGRMAFTCGVRRLPRRPRTRRAPPTAGRRNAELSVVDLRATRGPAPTLQRHYLNVYASTRAAAELSRLAFVATWSQIREAERTRGADPRAGPRGLTRRDEARQERLAWWLRSRGAATQERGRRQETFQEILALRPAGHPHNRRSRRISRDALGQASLCGFGHAPCTTVPAMGGRAARRCRRAIHRATHSLLRQPDPVCEDHLERVHWQHPQRGPCDRKSLAP